MMDQREQIRDKSTEPKVVFLDCGRRNAPEHRMRRGSTRSGLIGRSRDRALPPRARAAPDRRLRRAVLVALSGAFLIGLAVVGVLAAVVAGVELVRGICGAPAKATAGALDHQVGF